MNRFHFAVNFPSYNNKELNSIVVSHCLNVIYKRQGNLCENGIETEKQKCSEKKT